MNDHWLVGRQLSNFRVEEFLSRGGMGEVYRGWDVVLERPVAIKIIAGPYRNDQNYSDRFLREGRAMARWRHESIVQIYYAGQEEDLFYLVMEYVEGVDLKTRLDQLYSADERLPYEEVVRIGRSVAGALDYAHAFGIIHRDVKPSNILLSDDWRVLLTDFGLALDLQEGSIGEALGSPPYLSPEQALGSKEIVPQSDLYALGIVLYEMLTGDVPFKAELPIATALKHLREAPPSPRSLNPSLNARVEAVLLKSLSKSAGDRYATGHQLIEELADALSERALRERDELGPGNAASPPLVVSTTPVADRVAALLRRPTPIPVEAPARNEPTGRMLNSASLPIVALLVGVFLLCIVSILLFGFLVQPGASADPADAGAVSEQFENSGRNDGARAPAGAIAETAGDEAVGGAGGQESVAEDSDDQPAPTVTLPAEAEPAHNRLILFYNPAGFYAFNAGSRDIDVRPLSFVAIRDDGEHSEFRFDGVRWAGFFARIQPGKCDRLEIINASPRERPAQCRGYNALLTPEPVDRMNFWLARDGISDFRVTYGEQEVQLCQIAAGQCEVLLP